MNDEIRALEKEALDLHNRLSEARRRAEPEVVEDHELRSPNGEPVRLSGLFGEHDDLLVVHNMGRGCVYCTMWADGFDSLVPHLESRCAFVLCSADEPDVLREFAESRGWSFRAVSGTGSDFASAMGFLGDDGTVWPGVSAFHKRADGSIVRTGRTGFGPGDAFCSTWHFFDLLAGGAGDWKPRYSYG